MLFASSKPEGKTKTQETSVWRQAGPSQICSWHMLKSLLYKYHMRCSGKEFLVSSNYLIGKVTLNFPVPFPALCCNTCANRQEEMGETPLASSSRVPQSLETHQKQCIINIQHSGSQSNAFKNNSQCSPSPFTGNSDIPPASSHLLFLPASSMSTQQMQQRSDMPR